MFVHVCVCVCVALSPWFGMSVCLPFHRPIISLSLSPSICLCVCLSVCLYQEVSGDQMRQIFLVVTSLYREVLSTSSPGVDWCLIKTHPSFTSNQSPAVIWPQTSRCGQEDNRRAFSLTVTLRKSTNLSISNAWKIVRKGHNFRKAACPILNPHKYSSCFPALYCNVFR